MTDLLLPLLVAMAVQTVVLAQVNKIRIDAASEKAEEAKKLAGRAHGRIDRFMGVSKNG